MISLIWNKINKKEVAQVMHAESNLDFPSP